MSVFKLRFIQSIDCYRMLAACTCPDYQGRLYQRGHSSLFPSIMLEPLPHRLFTRLIVLRMAGLPQFALFFTKLSLLFLFIFGTKWYDIGN